MKKIIKVEGIKVPVGSHQGKTIVIAADHRGYQYKDFLMGFFRDTGYPVDNVGTFSPERCDYPIISDELGKVMSQDPYNQAGIAICGSGIGILIPASKHLGVYAGRCLTPEEAETSRKHNNTNVLGIGADYMDLETTVAVIKTWLKTPFYSTPEEKSYLDRFVQTVKLERK